MNLKNWKYKLAAMMQGRYGTDALHKALLVLMVIFLVLNFFFASSVLYVLSLMTGAVAVFRTFSKNKSQRVEENRKYLALRDGTKKKVLLLVNRVKGYKTHRYRACPNCKTVLRLNKKIGVNHVTCPVCKQAFDIEIKR